MIVLDEQLLGRQLEHTIGEWYQGSIRFVNELRPGTVIKDDAIAALLRQQRYPSFVTINVNHFWKKIRADRRFCVVCFKVLDKDVIRISGLLRLLFRNANFSAKNRRAGHVFRISLNERVQLYNYTDQRIQDFQL